MKTSFHSSVLRMTISVSLLILVTTVLEADFEGEGSVMTVSTELDTENWGALLPPITPPQAELVIKEAYQRLTHFIDLAGNPIEFELRNFDIIPESAFDEIYYADLAVLA